ncbi:MAG: NlpC/P60 family protein [Campylobacterales bacterium]
MMQTKYGWGGLYGERDCSSTLRDIFAPFGIWLPRNSSQQSKVGRVVSFEGLNDDEKLEKITSEAKPFETLLYLKGHILLYLGLYKGEPAVLHTVWGIKTVKENGDLGRYVVGKTVISSLRFGKELDGYSDTYSLLHQLENMNFVLEETPE